ncbi:MAG: hypothetical protein HOC20_04070 [Chloroflexi bacterium]|jgi:hypothetical protein|nr:hypothetical protein [Chloroflexota bacterium]
MSKLDDIRSFLEDNPELVWDEQSVKREHLRRNGYYYSISIRVAPKEPIMESELLQEFSKNLVAHLAPIGIDNATKCYEYAETRRDVIKTATLYYSEATATQDEAEVTETRIAVTLFPCEAMSTDLGIRAVIEIGHYECPNPCSQSKDCVFKGYWKGPIDDLGAGGRYPFQYPNKFGRQRGR